jgi:hypothetical protein
VSELDPRPDPRPEPDPQPDPRPEPGTPPERRPLVERIGMAAIAAALATMFGGVAVAAWAGGEPFLAVMGGIGSLMTAWVGGLTLFRG